MGKVYVNITKHTKINFKLGPNGKEISREEFDVSNNTRLAQPTRGIEEEEEKKGIKKNEV